MIGGEVCQDPMPIRARNLTAWQWEACASLSMSIVQSCLSLGKLFPGYGVELHSIIRATFYLARLHAVRWSGLTMTRTTSFWQATKDDGAIEQFFDPAVTVKHLSQQRRSQDKRNNL